MLPYDAEVLYAFFAQYARAIWPAGPLAALLAAVVLLLALRPLAGAASGRIVTGLLALAWGWVGWGFFLERFAQLNFAAPLYGGLFLLQALLLLLWAAMPSRRPGFRFEGGGLSRSGLVLALVALAVLPLAGPLAGEGWAAAPLVGLMPGPTALFTLGLLLLAEGRGPLHLAILPLLWAAVAGFEGWVLGLPHDLAVAGLGLAGFLLLARKRFAGR